MKILTKVALVSAMAISANAMALEALDDETLSAATGQDGVTISLTGPISMDYLAIVDVGGLGATHGIATANTGTGAIVIGGANGLIITPDNSIDLVIDADNNAGLPVLNVNVNLGDTDIEVGSISVAGSNATGSTLNNRTDILELGTLTLNGLEANIQLGNQPQGALIKLDSAITGGLSISNLALKQGATAGIGLGTVKITDAGGADLTLDLKIDATTDGLHIDGLTAMDISANNLVLGDLPTASAGANPTFTGGSPRVGALYVSNLNVGTGLTIKGH
jgi:hypothetical protein